LPVQQLSQIPVETLHSMRHDLKVLDVRDQGEWEEGHIKGAMHIPYYFLQAHLQDGRNELERYKTQPLAVLCGSGQRSSLASSILLRHGFTQLFNVVGGMEAWEKAGFEKEA